MAGGMGESVAVVEQKCTANWNLMGHSLSLCSSSWCRWALMKWELKPLTSGLVAAHGWVRERSRCQRSSSMTQCRVRHVLCCWQETTWVFWLLTELSRLVIRWNYVHVDDVREDFLRSRISFKHVFLTYKSFLDWLGYADIWSLHEVIPFFIPSIFIFFVPLPMILVPVHKEWFDVAEVGLVWAGCLWGTFPSAMGLTWRKPDQRLSLNLLQRSAADMGVCTLAHTQPSHQHMPHWS